MDLKTCSWIILIFSISISSFSLFGCISIILATFTFLLGVFSMLYLRKGDVNEFYRNCAGNPLTRSNISDGGLLQVVKQTLSPLKTYKSDNRMTGSELIDSSLQEILGYIIRDYVLPWYNLISLDEEFSHKTIKNTSQRLGINISNRIKEVDWIPYLTTKFVDDVASHLRLFKQAKARLKSHEVPRTPKNSPRRDLKASPKISHKRNKSETDIAWYFNRKDVERNVGSTSKFYVGDSNKKQSLEDIFFDLECTMENNAVCRDSTCMQIESEKEFLSELIEILLYIFLPDEDFECKPLRFFLRETFANCVFSPLIGMLSDPDYINQAIIWLCLNEGSISSETFLSTVRITDNYDELKCTRDLVTKEIQNLSSRDSGGESDIAIKQQLGSLTYVSKVIDNRLSKIENFDTLSNDDLDFNSFENKSIDLPLDVILKNNLALSYFIDHISCTFKQACLYFYLNIEGWKVSVEQQLTGLQQNKIKTGTDTSSIIYEKIRLTAMNIYDEYLGDKSEHKVEINPGISHKLFFRIRNLNELPSEYWFDDVQNLLLEKMKADEEFLPSFKKSRSYIKLLEDLDLLQQNICEDELVLINEDEVSKNDSLSPNNYEKAPKHARSLSDVTYLASQVNNTPSTNEPQHISDEAKTENCFENLKKGDFILSVKIIETGIVCEKGKTFGIYATHVSRQYDSGFLDEWHIYRRYSDFHDLYTKIKERYPDLAKIPFPGKKTFHNMDRAVLERRMKMLGYYLQEISQHYVLNSHPSLKELLMLFLEEGDYDRVASGPFSNKIDTIVNPIKSGMKSIKNMPEQIIQTVDEVVEKVFHQKAPNKPQEEASKVGASLDIESDDNIPLRIMLLLVDEIFDLKSRNQWLRRRIVTILRQIVRTMFGDIVNRRILEYVSFITSPKNVAHYLHIFQQSFWPNGIKAEDKPERDEGVKARTRLAAKIALLSSITDELKHIIGSETTRKGLLTIFELFQHPILNRRLIYVLIEGILSNLFPDKNMTEIFQKLHSNSKRFQDKEKTQLLKNR